MFRLIRIGFVSLGLALTFALVSFSSAQAQPAGKIYRIGFLGSESACYDQQPLDSLHTNLRELGYVEGRNLAVDVRLAQGRYDQLPVLATELINLKVDVVVTNGLKATVGAAQVTATIPIISTNMGDAVNAGLVDR